MKTKVINAVKDKPSVYDTMFLTLIEDSDNKEKTYKNYIVPLGSFHIEEKKDKYGATKNTIKIEIDREKYNIPPGRYDTINLALTDDPYCEHARGYGHLGTFRFTLIGYHCILKEKKEIEFDCMLYNWDSILPDRTL